MNNNYLKYYIIGTVFFLYKKVISHNVDSTPKDFALQGAVAGARHFRPVELMVLWSLSNTFSTYNY